VSPSSPSEWRRVAAEHIYTLRLFSGHWMIMFLLPALYFGLRRGDEVRTTREPAA
jgi:hypothetical protein